MQAALVAAKRGHRVTVLEKSDRIGGHVTLQAMLPGLEDRADLIRWLKLQLDKAGVEIQIGSEATPESIKAISPDAVIIATGARYSKTGISKRSEEHTSELQSLMRISYAVFCLKKTKQTPARIIKH